MRIQYHDLYDAEFEKLVVAVCIELLGAGVQPFSTGPDGGRDARFAGTARAFPNAEHPHVGNFVVQAKHTEHPCAKFSDADFSGDGATTVLEEELPRLRKLVAAKEVEHYLLFSNRRLAGDADERIRKYLGAAGLASVELFGVERIDLLLKRYPTILDVADVNTVDAPLRVTPDDLAAVLAALVQHGDAFAATRRQLPDLIQRTRFADKNKINGLTEEFAAFIKRNYLSYFEGIREFLAHPANAAALDRYRDAAAEFGEELVAHRADWPTFDRALTYLQRILFQRDGDLARRKRLTKLVIYYMYWNCDLGQERGA